jgi:hypothetical protein
LVIPIAPVFRLRLPQFAQMKTAADSIANTNQGITAFHNRNSDQADLIGRLVAVVAQLGWQGVSGVAVI